MVTKQSQRDSIGIASPKNRFEHTFMRRVLGIICGAILVYSAWMHLNNPYTFLSSIYGYEFPGRVAGVYAAAWLPYLQAVIGLCLLINLFPHSAALLGCFLLACFAVAQSYVLVRGQVVPCGCFGPSNESNVGVATLSLVSVLLIAMCCIARSAKPECNRVQSESIRA